MKQQWHSGFDDSSGWGRLIDPICLFILSQIAGTIWVIVPRQAFAPPVAPNPKVEVHHAEFAGLTNQKSALEKALSLAREEAATLALPVETTVTEKDRLAAQIRTEDEQVKELEAKLNELARKEDEAGQKLAGTPPPNPQLQADTVELSRQLAAKQAEVKRLQMALEVAKGSSDGSGVGSPRMVETTLTPMSVHLIGNRVVPVNGKHYRIETGLRVRTTGQEVVRYTKSVTGETVEDIRKPGSDLGIFLGNIDPSKQFLLCLVTNDSFAIFREVRKLARAKGIKVAWDTNYDSDGVLIFGPGKGNRRVGENP